jgi:GNAT superfamily N-acetyltransferase
MLPGDPFGTSVPFASPHAEGTEAATEDESMSTPVIIQAADTVTIRSLRWQLGELVADGFRAGSALGFAPPLTEATVQAYWSDVADDVAAGLRHVLIAYGGDGVVGCVQLVPDRALNGRHRAEVRMLVVLAAAQGRGIAGRLMSTVEDLAADLRLRLLHLTTHADQPAARLYERLGWTRLGVVPHYAAAPDGRLVDNVFFWKEIGQPIVTPG